MDKQNENEGFLPPITSPPSQQLKTFLDTDIFESKSAPKPKREISTKKIMNLKDPRLQKHQSQSISPNKQDKVVNIGLEQLYNQSVQDDPKEDNSPMYNQQVSFDKVQGRLDFPQNKLSIEDESMSKMKMDAMIAKKQHKSKLKKLEKEQKKRIFNKSTDIQKQMQEQIIDLYYRVNLQDYMPPVPRDQIFGLVQAQGHYVQHLGFALGLFFVDKSDDQINCGSEIFPIDLNKELQYLQLTHFLCFILLFGSKILNNFTLNSQLSIAMEISSLFLYTIMTLHNMQCFVENRSHPLNSMDCDQYQLGHAQQWMYLEVCAFFVNMGVLSINLIMSIVPSQALKKIIFTRKIDRIQQITELITRHQLKMMDMDNYKIVDDKSGIFTKQCKDIKEQINKKSMTEQIQSSTNFRQTPELHFAVANLDNLDTVQEDKEEDMDTSSRQFKPSTILKNLWIQHHDLTMQVKGLEFSIIPVGMIKAQLRATFKSQDLLQYLVGGKSFHRLCLTQMLNLIIASIFQGGGSIGYIYGLNDPTQCQPVGLFQSEFSLVFILLTFMHIVQPILMETQFLKTNKMLCIGLFTMIDVLIIFPFSARFKKGDCEPYMHIILITDIGLSIFAAFDIYLSQEFQDSEYRLIGKQILSLILSDHHDFVLDSLQPNIKRCEKSEEAFDVGEQKDHQKCSQKLTPHQNDYLKELIEEEEENNDRQRLNQQNQIKRKDQVLVLQEDIYSLTFVALIKVKNPILHKSLEFKCVITFIIQMSLIFVIAREHNGLEDIFTGDVYINSTRYICCILLHLQLMPEFKSAFDMMRYAVNNQDQFQEQKFFPFIISFMKVSASITTEIINIYVMGTYKKSGVVIYGYITFGIIINIDNLICMSVQNVNIEQAISEANILFSKVELHRGLIEFSQQTCQGGIKMNAEGLTKLGLIISFTIYEILNVFNITIYFYFLPLGSMLMCNLIGDGDTGSKYFNE